MINYTWFQYTYIGRVSIGKEKVNHMYRTYVFGDQHKYFPNGSGSRHYLSVDSPFWKDFDMVRLEYYVWVI